MNGMISKTFLSFLIIGAALYASTAAEDGEACAPGYFLPPSASECEACPAGTYQPNLGASDCIPCPEGFVNSNPGAALCKPCGKSETSSASRTTCRCLQGYEFNYRREKCQICKPGHRYDGGRDWSHCYQCFPGTYQPDEGAKTCLECPPGMKSGYAFTECIICPVGEAVIENKCGKCKPGRYFEKTTSSCIMCYPGSYMPSNNILSNCLPCPSGSYSGYGYSACVFCGKKKAFMKNGKCASCKPGQFYNMYNQRCYKCLHNTYTPKRNVFPSCFNCGYSSFAFRGSDSCKRCKYGLTLLNSGDCGMCPPGTYLDIYRGRKCVDCNVNSYNLEGIMEFCPNCPFNMYALPGSSSCFTCPEGQALIVKHKKCGMCPPGEFYQSSDAECIRCYSGTYKPEPGNHDCMVCPKGYSSDKSRTACE